MVMMGKPFHAPPAASTSPVTTRTSKLRSVRSTATSWAQDDENEYEIIENTECEAKNGKKKADPVKMLKKLAKKAVAVGKFASSLAPGASRDKNASKEESSVHAYLDEPVNVEDVFLEDAEGMDMRYGGGSPVDDGVDVDKASMDIAEATAEQMPFEGSAGRGTRDRF